MLLQKMVSDAQASKVSNGCARDGQWVMAVSGMLNVAPVMAGEQYLTLTTWHDKSTIHTEPSSGTYFEERNPSRH